MNSNVVMVRYGELSTKGKNIKDFIKKLANNIKDSLKEFTEHTYKVQHDHIYINLNGVEFEKVSGLELVVLPLYSTLMFFITMMLSLNLRVTIV